jgi:hypothetical protein
MVECAGNDVGDEIIDGMGDGIGDGELVIVREGLDEVEDGDDADADADGKSSGDGFAAESVGDDRPAGDPGSASPSSSSRPASLSHPIAAGSASPLVPIDERSSSIVILPNFPSLNALRKYTSAASVSASPPFRSVPSRLANASRSSLSDSIGLAGRPSAVCHDGVEGVGRRS